MAEIVLVHDLQTLQKLSCNGLCISLGHVALVCVDKAGKIAILNVLHSEEDVQTIRTAVLDTATHEHQIRFSTGGKAIHSRISESTKPTVPLNSSELRFWIFASQP